MGKLFMFFFLGTLFALLFYVATFLSYLLLGIRDLAAANGVNLFIPFSDRLQLTKNFAPIFFFLLLPFALFLGSAYVVIQSKRVRGSGYGTIRYEPINKPRICVALTAYNDEQSIYDAVSDFKQQEDVIDLIVVDNNSLDGTARRASEAGAVVVSESKQGYGYACIRGLKEALSHKDANIIVLAEGDQTFHGYDLRKLVPYLDNADMVLGTRTTQEFLDQKSQLGWFLVWGNLFLAKLIQLRFYDPKFWGRVRLTDVGCTFRALRREALGKIIDKLEVGGDHFSPHMTMTAIARGMKVVEVPITFRERVGLSKGAGRSKWRASKIGLGMLWYILRH